MTSTTAEAESGPENLTPAGRTALRAAHRLRTGWFTAQYLLSRRLSPRTQLPPEVRAAMPSATMLTTDRDALMQRDIDNIAAGYYRPPHDLLSNPLTTLSRSLAYFADLASVNRRRSGEEGPDLAVADADEFPEYYRRAYHHQTDGYLSEKSARLYDHQVEVLFGGAADAMRRQALVPMHHFMQGRNSAHARMIDIACGTGHFLSFVKDNYPRLRCTALDISPYYVAQARRNLAPWSRCEFVEAAIESCSLPIGAFDIATCIYLFHELPAAMHGDVAAAIAGLVKPDGLFVLVDSLQYGDRPEYDALLESFPFAFHEPYYADYLRQDLTKLFTAAGFEQQSIELAYLSRVMTFQRKGR
ncbi:MAG TPA: class I SAM-dependent methyltransferase [Verrucomicrobiae bacterium]|nr:class I SAM-dependent methyltransferase [Verrucomicrobiae bacterium]